MLRSLLLLRGYTLVFEEDGAGDITIFNNHHKQSLSLFHLARHVHLVDSKKEKYKCIREFVSKVCFQFEHRNPEGKRLENVYPMLRRQKDIQGNVWYALFETYVSKRISFSSHKDLVWCLGFQSDDHIKMCSVFDFSAMNISIETVWFRAKQNLQKSMSEKKIEDWGDGWFCCNCNDGFDASRLLIMEGFYHGLNDVVFSVPSRDLLAWAPIQYHDEMQRWAQEYFVSYPYPLSDQIGFFRKESS